jgi:hypothetical protein
LRELDFFFPTKSKIKKCPQTILISWSVKKPIGSGKDIYLVLAVYIIIITLKSRHLLSYFKDRKRYSLKNMLLQPRLVSGAWDATKKKMNRDVKIPRVYLLAREKDNKHNKLHARWQ